MTPKTLKLNTSRLQLRIPTLADIPTIFSATRYEGFNDGMLWEPPENEGACIPPYHRNIKAWEEGKGYAFSIDLKDSTTFIGRISIRKREEKGLWNIGFWMHPAHQGNGYMSEAVGAILAFGFEQLQAENIEAAHAIWNKASEKVLLKNGFVFQKYIPQGFQKKEVWVAENLLVINRSNWQKIQ